MFDWADANGVRVAAYVVVAALCFWAVPRENRDAVGSWPPFWLMTGGMLAVMAIGRGVDVANLLTDSLRDQARASGWYESRRRLQAIVVAVLAVTWLVSVIAAVWRVPARRRRYLPMIVVVLTIGFYAAVRVVSLHHVDGLLHRQEVAGVRVGTIIELGLLAVAGWWAMVIPGRSDQPRAIRRAGEEADGAVGLARSRR